MSNNLGKKVSYLACRHYILEGLVSAVWENVFGNGKITENPWLKHFNDIWAGLKAGNPTILLIGQKWLNQRNKDCTEMQTGNPQVEEAS